LACKPNLVFVPSSAREPSSTFMPSSIPTLIYSSDVDNKYENTPPPAHLPLYESIEHEPAPPPLLPRWVCSTREAVGDLVADPLD
jgi:hypothetical protein